MDSELLLKWISNSTEHQLLFATISHESDMLVFLLWYKLSKRIIRAIMQQRVNRNRKDGYGSETETLSKNLSLSDAMVRVYIGNERQETFYIPKNNGGTVWHVFDLDKNGIQAVNEFYSAFAIEVR